MELCYNKKPTRPHYQCTKEEGHTGDHGAIDISPALSSFLHEVYWPNKEDPMPKYKSLKPITIKAIWDSGIVTEGCGDFRLGVRKAVKEDPRYAWDEIPADIAQGIVECLGYPDWLIDHGFIAINEPEKFWKLGDRVKNKNGNTYIIAHTGQDRYGLINIDTGRTCDDNKFIPLGVSHHITLSEMRQMGYEGE